MIVKKHVSNGKVVLAVCDKEILGKTFEEGQLYLDLSSSFYQGEEVSEEQFMWMMQTANAVNIVGEKSVSFLKKQGYLDEDKILKVDNIPHAQISLE